MAKIKVSLKEKLTLKEKAKLKVKNKKKKVKKLTKSQASIFGVSEDTDISNIGYFGPADSSASRTVTKNKVPTIELTPNNTKMKKKLTNSQQRLQDTGLGGGNKQLAFGDVDNYNRFSSVNIPELSARVDKNKVTKSDRNLIYGIGDSRGLLVQGMTNRSKQKIAPGSAQLPTVFAVASTNNFTNPNFNKKNTPSTPRSVQSARSRSAGTTLNKSVSGLNKLSGFGIPVNTNIFTPSGAPRSSVGQIGKVSSPYGSYANPAFGAKTIKSTTKRPTMSQDQFAINIKMVSGGFGLGDVQERKRLEITSAGLKAAAKHRSRAKLKIDLAQMTSDPSLAEANRILALQGADYRFKVESRRIRRGKWKAQTVAYYIGPSTRTSYQRTIHNGRKVTAYRGLSPGQTVSRGSPISVVNAYNKAGAITDFAIANTDIKPTGKYYDTSLNLSSISSRISQLESMATRYKQQRGGWKRIPQKVYYRGNGLGFSASYRTIWYTPPAIQGTGPISAAGGKLTQAQANEYAKLIAQRPKAGHLGKQAFASHVEGVAASKKAIVDKYVDPLDSIYSYAAVSDDQITDLQKYGSDLTTNIGEFDSNIDLLQQGIARVQTVRGKATASRKAGMFGTSAYDAIESREKPFDTTISNTSHALADITGQLQSKQSSYLSEFGSGAVGKTKAGAETIIATPGNRTIKAGGYYGKSAYTARTGQTVISIPKDQIPANGKVVIEATVSYSGYKGPVKTVTSLGTVAGARGGRSQTIRKTLPVDANGNIVIKAAMTGNTRYHLTKTGLSNIKVIDPSKSSRGAQLVGDIGSLTSQQSQLQSNLKENQKVKSYFDDAQNFLTGKSTALKGKQGKTIATFSGGKLSVSDQDQFQDLFGTGFDSDSFGATRDIYTPLNALATRKASVTQQRQTVVDREATRGAILTTTKKTSLTSQASALDAKAASITKSARTVMASGVNNANNHHTKIEVRTSRRNQGRKEIARANAMYAEAAGLRAQAKDKRTYRDTGVDPTRPSETAISSQVAGFDTRLGSINATESFLTGRTNKLIIDSTGLTSAIANVKSVAAKDIGALSKQLSTMTTNNRRNESGYAWNKYVKNKGAVKAAHRAAEKVIADKIKARQAKATTKIAQLTEATSGGNPIEIASRDQGGKININYDSHFANLGLDMSKITKQTIAGPGTSNLASLEATVADKEKRQTALIAQLKTVQKERIKESANARVQQINALVRKRAINRREAAKQKKQIAAEVRGQNAAINTVDDSIPLPDITVFDNDLRSEAQKILDSTDAIAKGAIKEKIAGRLRQVTRSRKPKSSPIGAVLARGAVVPRPRPEFPNRRTTTLGSQNARISNPFIDGQ